VTVTTAQAFDRATDSWQSRMDDFGDRWNPVLVRELRRMMKGQLFRISYLVLTTFCLFSLYLRVMFELSLAEPREMGSEFCAMFLFMLSIPLMLVVPMALFMAVAEEQTGQTLEMVGITPLRTDQILWGYLWCGVIHAGLYYCALLPFISFSYLLRGMSWIDLAGGLTITSLVGFTAGLWGLMLGACAKGPLRRVVCTLATVGGGLLGLSILQTAISAIFFFQVGFEGWSTGLVCLSFVLFPLQLILFAVARQQLQLIDPLVRPYKVQLDSEGKVTRFIRNYSANYIEIPAWHDRTSEAVRSNSHAPRS